MFEKAKKKEKHHSESLPVFLEVLDSKMLDASMHRQERIRR